jgi:PPOX class probable F420-dependent enzyme
MAELNEKQTALLEGPNIAVLATIQADGKPQANPMWVDWDGTHVIMNTAIGRAKEKQIRRDPRVGITVFAADNPYEYVAVTGTAELTLDGAEAQIDKLAKKYIGQDVYPWRGPDEKRITIKITPETVSGMGS